MSAAAPAGPAVTVEVARLTVVRGRQAVVRDVSLTFRSDEAIALLGPNGAGKTSLMLAIQGLLPANGGRVRIDGRDIHTFSPVERARFAALVPQGLERIPELRVYDLVAGGRYAHLRPLMPLSVADRAAINDALTRCRLSHLADRPLRRLSAGERQKALLAAAIAQDAQMLLLDEPNTALDPAVLVELAALLREWHAGGRGFVLVSHDLHLPAVVADRAVFLRSGQIVADGPAAEILRADRLSPLFGVPFWESRAEDGRTLVAPRIG
jgi:iron complex transport system ATP-binding protein